MIAIKSRPIKTAIVTVIISGLLLFAGCLPGEVPEEEPAETEQEEEAAAEEEPEEVFEEEQEEIEEQPQEEQEPVQQETEQFFVYAILKGVSGSTISIEQLINEPNEKEVGPELEMAEDCRVTLSILVRNGSENEYTRNLAVGDIPVGQEIGILVENGTASQIIYQVMVDTGRQASIEPLDPEQEFFVYAILKGVSGSTISIEQLINEPNEKEVGPELALADDYSAYLSVVVRSDSGEMEYINETELGRIPRNQEVGLIVRNDEKIRAIIYSLGVE